MAALTEAVLTDAIQKRNALIEEYLEVIRRVVKRMMAARAVPGCLDVEDVVQDVAVELIKTVDKLKAKSVRSLRAYVLALVNRKVRASIAAAFRPDNYPLLLAAHASKPEPWMLFQDYHLSKKLLTKKQLEAVELVYVYGFTQEQAARKLGITPQVLRVRLSRAIKRLGIKKK